MGIRNPGTCLPLVAAALVLLAGCSSNDGINSPLPRSSRAQAKAKATSVVNALANAGGHRSSRVTTDDFSDCVGEHDEVAHDGRFTLQYSADIDAPPSQHNTIGLQIRAYMKRAKYSDVIWRPARTKNDEMLLRGYTGNWSVDVGSIVGNHGPGSEIYISVAAPCLLPPGVKQQKF